MKKFLFQEADFYGASKLIFGKNKLPICYKSSWLHGLGFALRNNYSSDIVIHFNEKNLPLHLVNNEETVSHLKNQKLNSIAVGMPIIYTKNFFEKNKSSNYKKLFMPNHSLNEFGAIDNLENWKKVIKKYNCDSICLTTNDFNFLKRKKYDFGNIKIIKGAYAGDNTSLERMSKIFLSTKEMVTDNVGSHVPYASAFGVNIRILDEIDETINNSFSDRLNSIPVSKKNFFQDYWGNPKKQLKEILSSVWVKGNDLEKREYSEYLLGIKHRKKIDLVREYLMPTNFKQKIHIFSSVLIKKFYNKYL
jgi:hypothetical protein